VAAFQAAIDGGCGLLRARCTYHLRLQICHHARQHARPHHQRHRRGAQAHLRRDSALDAGAKFSPSFAGTKVPTLGEAFDLAHGKINVYVDTKYADPQQLVETIVRHDMQDHVVIYGNPFLLYEVRKICPTLKVMPEAISPDICKFMVPAMQPQVLAFDANDSKTASSPVRKMQMRRSTLTASATPTIPRHGRRPSTWELQASKPTFPQNWPHTCAHTIWPPTKTEEDGVTLCKKILRRSRNSALT
jgi:hypothetical protein